MADIKYLDKTGLGTVKSILDGLFAPKSHNHNNLYYTKTESDNLLAGKSNTGHDHNNVYATISHGVHWNNFSNRALNSATWGTLTTANGYTPIFWMDSVNGGGVAFSDYNGQTFMQIDGDYYANEGRYKVWHAGNLTKVSQLANDSGYLASLPSHNHDYLPLTGGTITGTTGLTLQNSKVWVQGGSAAGSNSNRLTLDYGAPSDMKYQSGKRGLMLYSNAIAICDPYNGNSNNDSAWIRHIEETANTSVLEIALGDDGDTSEELRFRKYNTSNQIVYDILVPRKSGTIALISDIPTSLPASDVYAWAKAANKPTYTYSEVGAPMHKLLFTKQDYQYFVVLLCKIGTNSTNTCHRISGKIYTEVGGGARYQGADIDIWRSDWNNGNDSYTKFNEYGLGSAWKLITCTYGGVKWLALRHNNTQACNAYFQGTATGIDFTAIKYYTSNTSTVNNSEINNSIVEVTEYNQYAWKSEIPTSLPANGGSSTYAARLGDANGYYTKSSLDTALAGKAATHDHPYLSVSGGTMTGTPYINMPASAAAIADSQPFGITYGRIQSYGTMTIAADTDGSTTEFVNITAGYSVSNATAANGLSIGYNTLKWKGTNISCEGHTHSNYLTNITKDMVTTALGYTPPTTNTTYTFTDANPNLTWGTKSKVATVGGTDIHVTMPANPNTWPSLSNLGGVPINRSNYVYTNVACKYMAGTSPGYYRIIFPDIAKSIWNMVDMEIFVRQSYSTGNSGKILLYTHNNGSNIWQNLNATLVGNLTSDIKVYAAEGKYIYIGGCSAWGTINIDKILIGDGATTKDLSGITIDYVSSLPSVYQEATMRSYSTTGHTHTKSQITDFPTSLPANGGNATTATSAASLSGGSIATWGTLTSANGYTNVCTWDTGNTTGAFSLAGKGGQMSLQLDGFFYQNEGKYLVLDSNNYTTYTVKKDGTGATGTWGINITGSAGSVAWTNVTNRPTALSSFTNDSGYITNSPAYLEIMGNSVAYIDFHYNNSTTDFDARIACHANNQLRFHGHLTPSTSTVANAETIGLSNRRFNTIYALNGNFSGKVDAVSGFFDTSDERLKDIIDTVKVDIDKLSELRKVYFNFKNDPDKKHIGVIAQDVQKIYSEIVEENTDGMLTVDYSKLSVIALDAVDQLNQKNKELEDRLNKIENLLKDKGIL